MVTIFGGNFEIGERCKGGFFFPQFSIVDSKTVQRSALCRSQREFSNACFLAKFGIDTAENEPC